MSKEKILGYLTKTDTYISGELLSNELGVSRTAIWKGINRLKEEGYEIESIRNKGYKLIQRSSELVEDAVRLALPKDSRFEEIFVYDSIDSTNTQGKRLRQEGFEQEGLILARQQTAGKGRRGRQWLSPKDDGVFMSMLLTPDIEPTKASMLTLIAGVAVSKAVASMTQLKPMIKWPNDLVIESKKVCGILTEMSAELDYVHYVIVGIGVNVNQETFSEEISDMATSLKCHHGENISRPALIGAIVKEFEALYEQFLLEGNLGFLMDQYNLRCINVGRALKVVSRQSTVEGKGLGIDADGTLRIQLTDGTITTVNAGEVSVRGLYGYV